jgi:hypothetical protein
VKTLERNTLVLEFHPATFALKSPKRKRVVLNDLIVCLQTVDGLIALESIETRKYLLVFY